MKLPLKLDKSGRLYDSNFRTVADCRYAQSQPEVLVWAVNYHQRLVDALRKQVKSMNCICKFLTYTGDEPPCTTCKLRALLAEIDKEESRK